jgi:sec-independent protein translocase protein TatC
MFYRLNYFLYKNMLHYLLEIKNRFLLVLLAWIATICVSYWNKEVLLFTVVCSNFNEDSNSYYLIFTNVTEIFSSHIQLITFISFQIIIIYSSYHCFLFFTPAFFYTEYAFANFVFKLIALVWCVSSILVNFVFVPVSWKFFLSFRDIEQNSFLNLHFEAKLSEYLNFFITLCYLSIFYCTCFAVLVLFLNYVNANRRTVKKFRKINYYCFILFATIASPPDVFSQLAVSVTTITLYELILVSVMFRFSLLFLIRQPIKTYKNTRRKDKVPHT